MAYPTRGLNGGATLYSASSSLSRSRSNPAAPRFAGEAERARPGDRLAVVDPFAGHWEGSGPMSRPANRRPKGGRREKAADRWERWQFLTTVAKIVVEALDLLDHYLGGGGPRLRF